MEGLAPEVQALVGKETVTHYQVVGRDIWRFVQAIEDWNPLYTDPEYAKDSEYASIIAPPLFCQIFAYSDVPACELKEDGSPKELDVPLPTQRVLGGGSSFEIGEVVRAGDTIKARMKISDIYRKNGKGGTLYFVVIDNLWTNQYGEMVAHESATYIHR